LSLDFRIVFMYPLFKSSKMPLPDQESSQAIRFHSLPSQPWLEGGCIYLIDAEEEVFGEGITLIKYPSRSQSGKELAL
jgi:hypothetical protein